MRISVPAAVPSLVQTAVPSVKFVATKTDRDPTVVKLRGYELAGFVEKSRTSAPGVQLGVPQPLGETTESTDLSAESATAEPAKIHNAKTNTQNTNPGLPGLRPRPVLFTSLASSVEFSLCPFLHPLGETDREKISPDARFRVMVFPPGGLSPRLRATESKIGNPRGNSTRSPMVEANFNSQQGGRGEPA